MESKSSHPAIEHKDDSELIIGLVAAVGTNLDFIKTPIREMLTAYGYDVQEIRVSSDIIKKFSKNSEEKENYSRIDTLMSEGNRLRKVSKNNAFLSLAASALISSLRNRNEEKSPLPAPRKAYVIHSLKHPEEVNLLREIYTNGFYLIGVYADEERRRKYLQKHKYISIDNVEKLIKRDADENEKWGQHTRDTYELSDFFINFDNNIDRINNQLWRFLIYYLADLILVRRLMNMQCQWRILHLCAQQIFLVK